MDLQSTGTLLPYTILWGNPYGGCHIPYYVHCLKHPNPSTQIKVYTHAQADDGAMVVSLQVTYVLVAPRSHIYRLALI